MKSKLVAAMLAALAVPFASARAEEQALPPVEFHAIYVGDALAATRGGTDHRLRYLDNLDVTVDADLERLVGWKGATLHLDVLNNLGLRPNDAVGSLQGVDNIEVADRRLKLYEAWIEQSIGERAALLVGLLGLDSEFEVTESAGLLLGPAFGTTSELGATGIAGPAIFPSPSPAVRLFVRIGAKGYARAALFNARAGVPGDRGGADFGFDDGVLMIGEAGLEGDGKLALGAWRYSKRQDDIRDLDAAGAPVRRRVQGAYLLAEYPLLRHEDGPRITSFLRVGVSDGHTTPFKASWQAGFLADDLIPSRPDGQLSFGVAQGNLSYRFRRNQFDAGIAPVKAETSFELTYADKLASWLTIQPDVQYVLHPGGDRGARDVIVPGLRVVMEY